MRKVNGRSARRSALVALIAGAIVTTVAAPAAAAQPDGPTLAPLRPGGPKTVADQYIVVLKDAPSGVSRAARAGRSVAAAATAEQSGGTVLARYGHALDGYAAYLPPSALAKVRADPAVKYVERDSVIQGEGAGGAVPQTDQPNPPSWGLDRINQRSLPLDNNFSYTSTGVGVTAYILDSGIRATHVDFGGRASGVYDAVGDGNGTNDCHGHGTHVAGTVAGATYGVAKAATIKAIRVLQCDNSGYISDLIEGVDWLVDNHDPVSVANFSLQGYGTSPNEAIENLLDAGVFTVFIANNFNGNACDNGPRSSRGVTVAATDITDTRASFSSYGACVDLFAPGVGITSASNASDTGSASGWSGTSMAAPHVTGWLARYRQLHPTATMAQAKADLIAATTKNVVIDPGPNSPNRLLYADPNDTITVDPTAPTAPGQPIASNVTSNSVQLSWPASTDNVGVVGYDVYRGSTLAAQSTTTSASITGLSPSTTYTFSVRARDAAGNVSDSSPTVTVTTQAPSGLACAVTYQVSSSWNPGFAVNVTLVNTGTVAVNGWTLAWDFAAGEHLTTGYNATWSQTGTRVTAVNLGWNQVIAPGGSVSLGFEGTHSGSTPTPAPITVNGVTCT
ncbi:Serine protease, subtilisin family [Micromonospora eburnea]|uniref:Serine protease, subtilisin family n=1 Tax=Micromonospora eburnea TaxID=227316 RepID=A0A1C6VPH9_9ACTN|nr:Serine protease, subtilisin family [Micromonospora eburnea]